MSEVENIVPLPRQRAALTCPAFEIMFGGQKGGSKSFWLCLECGPPIQRAHEVRLRTGAEQRECRVIVFRRNLGDLTDIINKSHRIFPVFDQSAKYNSNEKIWRFWSGATVEFHHLDGPDDHLGWNGQAITCALFDQVEEIPEEVYAFLVAQVRPSGPDYKDLLKVRCTANPGGKHGDWVKKRFVDPHPAGNKILVEKVTNRDGRQVEVTRAFIPSALQDNPYLNDDGVYEARMRATLPDHMLKMYLEGDWNTVVGAFFSSRIRPEKHFIDSFPISGSWNVKFGLDWGASNPACAIFGAKDADDRLWIIDEFHEPGNTGRIFGERLRKKVQRQQWSAEKKWAHGDFYGLIDKQALGGYGSEGASAGAGIASEGFRLFEANKDRASGVEQILERLVIRADGKPGVVIFKDRCPNLCRQLLTARTDPATREDYDIDGHYDAIDAFRFLLMDWQVETARTKDPHFDQIRRWEEMTRKRRPVAESTDYDVSTGYDS